MNSIVFNSGGASFTLYIPVPDCQHEGSELIISGTGVTNNSGVSQSFAVGGFCGGQLIFNNAATAGDVGIVIGNGGNEYAAHGETIFNDTSSAAGASIFNKSAFEGHGQTIFNGASTADQASISNVGGGDAHGVGGQTIFNDTSTATDASIDNWGTSVGATDGASGGYTVFNDRSTADHATITSHEGSYGSREGQTIFNDSSTAGSAILVANGSTYGFYYSGAIVFMVLRRVASRG